ncbi:MAG: hypothetical protein AUJ75_04065 [Candidatus Omnitrophica bacterium CG1_02_49_10]|nr:MAG: hypothetical protein AUJ75_04065 [Candidatus Omnitrophica bacterium CG1_02_49_10]
MARITNLIIIFSLIFALLPVSASASLFGVSEGEEIEIGRQTAYQLEQKFGTYNDYRANAHVNAVGQRIARISDRPGLEYHFGILDSDDVNALSAPGGFIYINRGLLEQVDNDDELAGVLAHEIAHVTARHAVKQIEQQMGYGIGLTLLSLFMRKSKHATDIQRVANISIDMLMKGYSRKDEYEADDIGFTYASKAGFDTNGMIAFLRKLERLEEGGFSKLLVFMSTHPALSDRVVRLKAKSYSGTLDDSSQFREGETLEEFKERIRREVSANRKKR